MSRKSRRPRIVVCQECALQFITKNRNVYCGTDCRNRAATRKRLLAAGKVVVTDTLPECYRFHEWWDKAGIAR